MIGFNLFFAVATAATKANSSTSLLPPRPRPRNGHASVPLAASFARTARRAGESVARVVSVEAAKLVTVPARRENLRLRRSTRRGEMRLARCDKVLLRVAALAVASGLRQPSRETRYESGFYGGGTGIPRPRRRPAAIRPSTTASVARSVPHAHSERQSNFFCLSQMPPV